VCGRAHRALAAMRELAGIPDTLFVTLATDAAGAVASDQTYQRGLSAGLSPANFLADNDSYTYFSTLNDLLKTGPSGTNVNDLMVCFGFASG